MPSHVHLIIGTRNKSMQDILRDFKSYTSRKLKEEIEQHPTESRGEWILWMMKRAGTRNGNNKSWQLWQQHNHPIELRSNKIMDQRLEYLHLNPVVSGLLLFCWSTRNDCGLTVPIFLSPSLWIFL